MEICSFESSAKLELPCWKKKKIPLSCFENGKGVFLLHPLDSNQLARLPQTWNENPLSGHGADFRRFLARGDWGFLCDSLQLSLGWDRSGQAEFLKESEQDPLLLGLSKCQGPLGTCYNHVVFAIGNWSILSPHAAGRLLLFPKPEDTVWEKKKQRGHERRRKEGGWEGWIDRSLFRSSWKTQWGEKPSWLVCFSSFFFPRVWSGEGEMGKKKGRGEGLASPEQKQHEAFRVGEGKGIWWFGDLLGSLLSGQSLPSSEWCCQKYILNEEKPSGWSLPTPVLGKNTIYFFFQLGLGWMLMSALFFSSIEFL